MANSNLTKIRRRKRHGRKGGRKGMLGVFKHLLPFMTNTFRKPAGPNSSKQRAGNIRLKTYKGRR